MRVVKEHISGKILTSTVKDSQNNIQPAFDSNQSMTVTVTELSALLDLVVILQS